jgi:hypothetical protein
MLKNKALIWLISMPETHSVVPILQQRSALRLNSPV